MGLCGFKLTVPAGTIVPSALRRRTSISKFKESKGRLSDTSGCITRNKPSGVSPRSRQLMRSNSSWCCWKNRSPDRMTTMRWRDRFLAIRHRVSAAETMSLSSEVLELVSTHQAGRYICNAKLWLSIWKWCRADQRSDGVALDLAFRHAALIENDNEFVAAKWRANKSAGCKTLSHALSYLLQNQVPCGVTVQIIDQLEPVQIKNTLKATGRCWVAARLLPQAPQIRHPVSGSRLAKNSSRCCGGNPLGDILQGAFR